MRKPVKRPVWLEKVSFNPPEGCSEQVCNDLSGILCPSVVRKTSGRDRPRVAKSGERDWCAIARLLSHTLPIYTATQTASHLRAIKVQSGTCHVQYIKFLSQNPQDCTTGGKQQQPNHRRRTN